MISYIVASHDRTVLESNLIASLQCFSGDEIIVIESPQSIAKAYNEGQLRAKNAIRCYIHHDVRVLRAELLRSQLINCCTGDVGVVGIIGSREVHVPWWNGTRCGSVVDARLGLLDFGVGGQCAYLDGLLLASAHELSWDESYSGFHLYDHDICQQALSRGYSNWCLDQGKDLVLHNTRGSTDVHQLELWDSSVARFRRKWNL